LDQDYKFGGSAVTVNVKLSEALVAEAKRVGSVSHRSLPKQIEYWSQIGKISEENPNLPFSVIKDILTSRTETAMEEYVFGE
jgi:hypothetical protein